MRQVSITQHHNSPTSVWIDGTTHHADNMAQIGAVLRDAGVKPDVKCFWMSERGHTDKLLAQHWLKHAPETKPKRGKRK